MSAPIVRYETAPTLTMRYPDCDACAVEVDHDGDGWVCPRCGTAWETSADEDTPGTLYEDWAGEPNTGVLRTHENGWERVPEEPNPWGDFATDLAKALTVRTAP